MTRLSSKKRRALRPAQFAVPELDGYPIHDREHVALAKGRLQQFGSRLPPAVRARAWQRVEAADLRFERTGPRSSGRALAQLPPKTIVQLHKKGLIRFL